MIVAVAGRVAALDVATGRELWRNELSGAGTGTVELVIDNGRIFVAVGSTSVVACIDYETGRELWRTTTATYGRATMVVDGPRIFVARQGYVDCIDRDGNVLWSNGLSGLGVGPTAIGVEGNVAQADDVGAR